VLRFTLSERAFHWLVAVAFFSGDVMAGPPAVGSGG
jgi:cytochrome b subunit of formate dehydrogenase